MKLIFYFAIPVLSVWNIVEFVLYVAHRDPFNWIALWVLIADFVIAICISVDAARNMRIHRENIERMKNPAAKSRFQERLEEAQRQQKAARKNP